MPYISNTKNLRGFTLIEILIAIFVLAIGIFGAMALFPVGIYQTGKIAKNTIGAISTEIPLAYSFYEYPGTTTPYEIQNIVNLISGTTTPVCYAYPATGTITITGNYGWNTSLVPVDMDTPGNGTATSIEETYLFRQQIAIYKNYTANSGTATFTLGNTTISGVSNINNISVNDYLCNTQNHIWYRITGVNNTANQITIKQPYEYKTETATYYSTNTIVSLYNTMLTPH